MALGRTGAAIVIAAEGVTAAAGAFVSSDEQPGAAPMTATAPHTRRRSGARRMRSIYATLAAVMLRTGFWECCRP